MSASLLRFETRRALGAALSPLALAALLVTGGLMAALVAGGRGLVPSEVEWAPAMSVVGALWALSAGVNVNERNRRTLVEDIWWRLEPRPLRQSAAIFVAWLLVALFQGATVGACITLFMGTPEGAVAQFVHGFALAAPLGLLLSAIARMTAGATFLMGVLFLGSLLFMGPIEQVGNAIAAGSGATLAAVGYVVLSLAAWAAVASRTPR